MFTMKQYLSAKPGRSRELMLESNEAQLDRELQEIQNTIDDINYDLSHPYDKRADLVKFSVDGVTHLGIVNNWVKRVTVLVRDRRNGLPFSDGVRYRKYLVPRDLVQVVRRGTHSRLMPHTMTFEGVSGGRSNG